MIIDQIKLKSGVIYHDASINISVEKDLIIEADYNKVLGLGERYDAINHKGKIVVNKVEEKFCNQGEKTYFPLPFFMLDNGYGFFIDTKSVISFDFSKEISISLSEDSNTNLYILKGTYQEMISDFLEITGKTKKAPKWIFGPWISAHRWNSQAIVNDVRKKLKKLNVPVTVLVLEQWSDEATFYIFNGAKYPSKEYLNYKDFDFSNSPWYNPKKMIEELHDDGIKLLLWQCPVVKHIPSDEPYNKRHEKEWHQAIKESLVVKSKDKAYRIPEGHWFNGSMVPDFTNPDTLDWWFKNRDYLMAIGVDGFKTDGGEFIHTSVMNSIGENEKELVNNYSLEYVKAYSDFIGDDKVAFSRAGYTGQQKYSLQWAGDQKSTFEELQAVYKAGINASLSGQINWGFDISGFSGELPSLELYYRSTQLSVFTPIMQVHSEPVGGQFSATDPIREFNNERTIWNLAKDDESVLNDLRKLYNLRMNILPYTYSEYLKALEKKSTLMKHMNIDYKGSYPDHQFIYGNLLIAQVLNKDKKDMQIILPKGNFYNIFTDELFQGTYNETNIKISEMFIYIPEGSALVTKENSLMPEIIDNSIYYNKLNVKLYGHEGNYRFVDDKNDFVISWKDNQVYIEGKSDLELSWQIIV